MLRSLYIQNYALIEKLDITFDEGFSVITGETGAGKSIIIGAIGLLLGQRADTRAIRQGAAKCIIEARFEITTYRLQAFFEENDIDYEDECFIRREVYSSGKSRAFINDTPVSLPLVKELGEQLIDVHSQHQNLLLNKEDFQLSVLDVLAHNELILENYRKAYQEWKRVEKKLAEVIRQAELDKEDEDYIRFQLEQLQQARLKDDEQEELEQEAEILAHAEEIKGNLYRADQILNGDEKSLVSLLKECLNTLAGISKVYPKANELSQRLESCYIDVKDIALEVGHCVEEVDFDPSQLEKVNERLNYIYSLQQKHHVQTIAELISLTNDYTDKLAGIVSSDDKIAELTKHRDELHQNVEKQALILTGKRKTSAGEMEKQMVDSLIPLGMPNMRFKVEITDRKESGPNGKDTVSFLFSANKNGALQNISAVASGGEIARVMLSLKAIIAKASQLPTIIFDEIDTGVSGEIADRMADIMLDMGQQVISITHLPQIAARGNTHYLVYKQDNDYETNSHIRRLSENERIEELARMLSGATLTEAALNNAKELLKKSR